MKNPIFIYFLALFLSFSFFVNIASAGGCPTIPPGTMVKVEGKSSIYVINKDNKIMFFPSGDEFKSWNLTDSYSGYVTIPQVCFDDYQVPTTFPMAVNFRPGSTLIKKEGSNDLYAIKPGNVLTYIRADQAAALYGNPYRVKPIDTEVDSLSNRTQGMTASLPVTSAVRDNTPAAQPATQVVIRPFSLPAPSIITPVDGQVVKPITGTERSVKPVWTTVEGANKYIIENYYYHCLASINDDVCWGTYDSPYTVLASETKQGSTNIFNSLFLRQDGTFRMRIRAVANDGSLGAWSDFVTYSVDASSINVAAPTITLPIAWQVFNNANRSVQVQWNALQGAANYEISSECFRSAPSGYVMVTSSVVTTNFSMVVVPFDGWCRTHVRGYSTSKRWGPWSDYVSYNIDTSGSQQASVLSTKPNITSPTPNSNYNSGDVNIAWTRVDGAIKYSVNLSCSTCSIHDPWWNIKTVTDLFYTIPTSLFASGNQTYTVLVTPIDATLHDGTPSDLVTFTVQR